MNRARRTFCFVVAAVVGSAPRVPTAAQSPDDRAAFVGFRGGFLQVRDSKALGALHDSVTKLVASHPADGLLHLELGFLALRLADVTGDLVHVDAAQDEFKRVTEAHPDWPYAWLGRGLAEVGHVEAQSDLLLGPERLLRLDPLKHAKEFLAQSVIADTTFTSGLSEFASAAMRQHAPERLEAALGALRAIAGGAAGDLPALLLARARMEREAGDQDSALTAAARLLVREPANAAALLEQGRTLLTIGRTTGTEPWYRGLALADTVTLGLYRDDLAHILPDSIMQAFNAAPTGAARVAIVRRYWDTRDPDGLPTGAERLRDHYVRLDYARRRFFPARHYDVVQADEPRSEDFDARGVVYIRHGAPDERTFVSLPGLPPNQSWAYHEPGGTELVFNFVVYDGDPGYRIVGSILDILAMSGQARIARQGDRGLLPSDTAGKAVETYGAGLLAQTAEELLTSRVNIPIYARIISGGKDSAAALQVVERALTQKSAAAGESWRFTYDRPLPAQLEVVAIGTDAAGPEIQLTFAIPAGSASTEQLTHGVVYPVRMRASMVTQDGRVVATVDTVRGFVSPTVIPFSEHLLGRLPVQVPPGTYTVHVALETAERGILVTTHNVTVAALTTPSLALSDLALGSRNIKLSLRGLHGDTAWLNPMAEFKQNESMQLYCEIGGLAPGAAYRIELSVIRRQGGDTSRTRGEALKLGFDATKSGAVDPIHREVSLKQLAPGDYLLQITASTAAGERVVRRRAFTIVKPSSTN